MNWYLQAGKDSDVVLNTKIKYLRNLRNYKFTTNNQKEIREIEELVKEKAPSIGYNLKFLRLKEFDKLSREALCEKGIINQSILEDKLNKSSLLINDDENICIVINAENHIEIEVFDSGMQIENLYNLGKEIDEKIENNFDIAKSKKYGYLTTSPVNVGTGLRGEATLHLPGLIKTGNIGKIIQTVNNFGLSMTPKYLKNQEALGDIYIVSNKQTLGISEQNIVDNLKSIIETIISQERRARKLMTTNQIELEDRIYRKYGIMSNTKKIKWEEAIDLLSDVKMGTDLGIIKELNDEKVLKLNLYIKQANLQKFVGKKLEAYDRDIKRAEIIKQIIGKENA